MLKMHCPIATNGTKFVYRDDNTGEYVLATYSLNMRIPEIYLFPCTGTGKITDFGELYGEKFIDLLNNKEIKSATPATSALYLGLSETNIQEKEDIWYISSN